ncbi:AbrB/MazE/SpoVT family DNA-binding domain-containing protein [Iamia sp.]|uniref:AbrB/MazE/SpoVT family DNA-binding domain-containing protein n=1 Tax=Iamia sp. TaxID=2722710 RepID=UPI002BCF8786|nr:AbrB/MazE/SpoVT family DNA-binding domain-containing protein [Iamia sp.]HXH56328.1 AbrB/MazE/SpoVT family DNA-binding domain-containing protein [Iamia sp.]
MSEVKDHRGRGAKISSKHQITIPVAALRAAGVEAGERLVARSDGPGRIVLQREGDVLGEFAGALTSAFRTDELAALRDEWD